MESEPIIVEEPIISKPRVLIEEEIKSKPAENAPDIKDNNNDDLIQINKAAVALLAK